MSDSDNGKDCKHENLQIRALNPYGFNIYCIKCDNSILEGDYVIRTKAYYQAREDVIEAGEAYLLSCDDEGENGDYQLFCEMKEALQKDQPEEEANDK